VHFVFKKNYVITLSNDVRSKNSALVMPFNDRCYMILFILCRESGFKTRFSEDRPFVLSETGVNAKTGSGVRCNQYIDSDPRGFMRQTSSLQTFNSINTCLLLIQFHHFPCPGSNHNSVYVILNWSSIANLRIS
jgi:hypothetical protein